MAITAIVSGGATCDVTDAAAQEPPRLTVPCLRAGRDGTSRAWSAAETELRHAASVRSKRQMMDRDGWQTNQAAFAAFAALFNTLEERNRSLELRVTSLEADAAKMAMTITTIESKMGLDLMLAKIIIDR